MVYGAAQLLGERLGFGVGQVKVHEPDMGSGSVPLQPDGR
jgi:hypothetical protein